MVVLDCALVWGGGMADFTYEDLESKTIAELRDIAKGLEHEAVKGHSQLRKGHLLSAVCQAIGVDAHKHRHVVGVLIRTPTRRKYVNSRSIDKRRLGCTRSRQAEGCTSSSPSLESPSSYPRSLTARCASKVRPTIDY